MVFAVEVGLDEFLSVRGRVATPRSERCPGCGHARVPFDGWWTKLTRRGPVNIHRVLCAGCGRSHSCWPDVLVGRRVDLAAVIGAALEAKVAGVGHRRIGRRHHQALRALSNRWVGILHGCLRHRSTYSEATA